MLIVSMHPPFASKIQDIYQHVRDGNIVVLRRRFSNGDIARINKRSSPSVIVMIALGYYDLQVAIQELESALPELLFFDVKRLGGKSLLSGLADFFEQVNREAGGEHVKWLLEEYYRSLSQDLAWHATQQADTLRSIQIGMRIVEKIGKTDPAVRSILQALGPSIADYERQIEKLHEELMRTAFFIRTIGSGPDEFVTGLRRLDKHQEELRKLYQTLNTILRPVLSRDRERSQAQPA